MHPSSSSLSVVVFPASRARPHLSAFFFGCSIRMTDGDDDTMRWMTGGGDDADDDWWEFWMDTFSEIQSIRSHAHGGMVRNVRAGGIVMG